MSSSDHWERRWQISKSLSTGEAVSALTRGSSGIVSGLDSCRINKLRDALDRHIGDLTFLCTELRLENDRKFSLDQDAIRRNQQNLQHGQNVNLQLVSEIMPARVSMATMRRSRRLSSL